MREDADLSQTQLGEAINMTQRKVSYIECGKYEPSVDDIVVLCKFFKVSSDYLLGLSEQKTTRRNDSTRYFLPAL